MCKKKKKIFQVKWQQAGRRLGSLFVEVLFGARLIELAIIELHSNYRSDLANVMTSMPEKQHTHRHTHTMYGGYGQLCNNKITGNFFCPAGHQNTTGWCNIENCSTSKAEAAECSGRCKACLHAAIKRPQLPQTVSLVSSVRGRNFSVSSTVNTFKQFKVRRLQSIRVWSSPICS